MKKGKEVLGYHILLEFHGCPSHIIKDSSLVESILLKAAQVSGVHIVKSFFHRFNPHGLSGVIVISESHFTIHTWPEYSYVAIDFFSCTKDVNLERGIEYLKKKLNPKSVSRIELKRGIV
jgi:S-adenosylmethionine decarboxylase